ncbi:hypothetical protein FRC17_009504 [Serendipita sp. 399]|nr:hypothetical protein FRC17_009504 [Serendipita sp. 399]
MTDGEHGVSLQTKQVSSNRVTCATPDVVQVHANPEHSVVPSLLRGVPDLSIITSSNPSYIYTYTASLHTSDSASFVFPPLTLAISSSSGTNAEPIFVQTNDFLQLLAQFSNTLSTATPLVIHQLSRIPTLLSQRRRDDPETMYSVIPNEPIRVVRLYSLPSRDMDVGTSLNQLVGLVSPGHAVMSTSTTKMTPTATGMGVRRRGTRQEIEKLNGNSGRSSSDATTLVNGESREGEGGRNATEAPSAIFTLSKSKSTSMNGDRGVLFRRKIPVPFGGSKGLMVRTTLLISSLVVYVVSLIFGLLGLSLHLEWAERKGAITHGDEAKNTVDSDASNTESTPRRPTISSLPSPSPPVASVPSSPPILSKFLLTPAELNPGDQRTSTQIHLLYKGTDPNSLQFFLDGRRLEPRSIVHTSFEYVTQSQSQTFGQESQLSDKGDDFHEFVVRVDKFENVAGWSGRGRGSHSLEVVSSI